MISRTRRAWPVKTCIAAGLSLALGSAAAQTATEVALAARLDQLAAELSVVRAQLAAMQQARPAAAPAALSQAQPQPEPARAAASAEPSPVTAPAGPATALTSYGEINFSRPFRATANAAPAQMDMRRFVLGFQHRFDDKTKVVAELEVEHSVTSASDPGEVAVEQAYVERQLTPSLALRAGLFLMPVGLLNENHEPTAFYGVERNQVETRIIPSTWREGGAQLLGQFDNGLTAQAGISTGFDLTKWDAAASKGRDAPLASVHQELALAKSRDMALFGAVNWRGLPGLLIGGSLFSGQATHGQAAAQARISLWDLHARWTPGRWDVSALVTRASISNTAALNAPLVGHPTLIPARFDGYYLQAAYKLWSRQEQSLSPFARWERLNTAAAYADLGPGLTPEAGRPERVLTLGANYHWTAGVVLKADVQRFVDNADLNRLNLGLGWSF